MDDHPQIWILRHGDAAPTAEGGGDAERPLTPSGEAAMSGLGRAAAGRGLRAARVLSSPLLRARRTAALAGDGLAPGVPVEVDRRLAPGGDAEALAREALAAGPLPALLVGHNPDLEHLVWRLSGETLPLRKGAFVRIAFEGDRGRVLERPGE